MTNAKHPEIRKGAHEFQEHVDAEDLVRKACPNGAAVEDSVNKLFEAWVITTSEYCELTIDEQNEFMKQAGDATARILSAIRCRRSP